MSSTHGTQQRTTLIADVLDAIPGAKLGGGDGREDLHVFRRSRAVAIDDDLDDTGESFTLNKLVGQDVDADGFGNWSFDGLPVSGTAQEIQDEAIAFLLRA